MAEQVLQALVRSAPYVLVASVVIVILASAVLALRSAKDSVADELCRGDSGEIERSMHDTYPYASMPEREAVAVVSMDPYAEKGACKVTYKIGDRPEESRLYRFGTDSRIRGISLPFEPYRWCNDSACRGFIA